MSSINNRPNMDVFGHCIICHKNMVRQQVIDGVLQNRLTSEYCETQYLLDDGSKMRVAMCRGCKDSLNGNEKTEVMKFVIKGWEHEVQTYAHWDEDKKKSYIDRYKKLEIVTRADNKKDKELRKELGKFKPKKKGKKPWSR